MAIWDSCDAISTIEGFWRCIESETHPGIETDLPLAINTMDKVEGSASIGAVVPTGIYNAYLFKRYDVSVTPHWDFRAEPILKFRFKQKDKVVPLYFSIHTREPSGWDWHSWGYGDIAQGTQPDVWNEIEIDLRYSLKGPLSDDALSKVAQVTTTIVAAYNGADLLIDWFETFFAPTEKLSMAITPTSTQLMEGMTELFTAIPRGGTAPYTITWKVDNIPIATGLTYTYPAGKVGTHIITCEVTDSIGATASAEAIAIVVAKPPPPTKLHVEGRYTKNISNERVKLLGVNYNCYLDASDGWWHPAQYAYWGHWDERDVRNHLQKMAALRVKILRILIPIDWWKTNAATTSTGTSSDKPFRDAIRETVTIAYEYGIYVSIVPWMVSHTAGQATLPFPPFQGSDASIIANEQEWVNFWLTVVSELGANANIIWELHNEPSPVPEWFTAAKYCIEAIRNIGDDHIIIIAGTGSWDVHWVDDFARSNYSNIVYTAHGYAANAGDTFRWDAPDYTPVSQSWWQYNTIKTRMAELGYFHVINDLKLPLWIGEIGADPNVEHELEWWTNVLKILNENNMEYAAWVWRSGVSFALIRDSLPLSVTDIGIIYFNALAEATPPPTPIPPIINVISPFAIGIIMLALSRRR